MVAEGLSRDEQHTGNTTPGNLGPDSLPPLNPLHLKGYKETTKHRLMNNEVADNIRSLIPSRLQLHEEWELLYSMEQHGLSLNTLYRQFKGEKRSSRELGFGADVVSRMMATPPGSSAFMSTTPRVRHGYVIIAQDDSHGLLGCYINEPLKPMDQKRYYGNGECFVWKKAQKEPFKAFMYTGLNDNIIYSNYDFITIGSSQGHNSIWIDKSLAFAVSCYCDTFGNEVLGGRHRDDKTSSFKLKGLEVWRVG